MLLVPSLRDEMLIIGNFTGHPSLTLRAGFVEIEKARERLGARSGASACRRSRRRGACRTAPTLIGRLFDEGTLVRVGMALERAAAVAAERPAGFA